MPTDVAHAGRAVESSATAPNVLSPRTVLVHCAIARSENETPVQGHVWLALHWILRTPVLCLKPLNGPIEFFFLKTFDPPERDASGCGWHLISKLKVHCKAGEQGNGEVFRSEVTRLYPVTTPAIDQQLEDVVDTIRGFTTQVLAKSDFQHLLASPDEFSRLELPDYPTQDSAQAPVASSVSPLAPASPQPAEERSEVYSSDEDEAEESPVSEGFVSRLSHRELSVRRHAMYSRQGPKEQRLYHGIYVGPLCFNADEDTDDSGGGSPRSSTQDFESSSTSGSDTSFIEGGYESYEDSEMLCSDFSDDIFEEDYCEQFLDWPDYLARDSIRDTLPSRCALKPWRTECTVSFDEADMEDTWELPPLTASDCAGELDMIRYTISLSKMAFEEDAAAAISSERCASLAGQLDRARFASQMQAVTDYWDNRRSSLRRRHTLKESPAKFSTKRGRRQHQQDLRKARAHRKTDRTGGPRPAQPVAQPRLAFSFAPPTAPTIPLTATMGVFMFGARARPSLSAQGSANLRDAPRTPGRDTGAKPVLTASSVDAKPHPARCKRSGVTSSSGALLHEKAFGPPCQVEDSQLVDSDRASDASTVPILATLLSLICGFRPDVPRRRRKVRVCKSSWLVPQSFIIDTALGKHCQDPRRHLPRCTRALMRALGRSRWLNGLCRGLHRGCTDGTGPRPSVEP